MDVKPAEVNEDEPGTDVREAGCAADSLEELRAALAAAVAERGAAAGTALFHSTSSSTSNAAAAHDTHLATPTKTPNCGAKSPRPPTRDPRNAQFRVPLK